MEENRAIFPTSSDIFIEINGKRLAGVTNYKVSIKKQIRYINAFGEKEAIGSIDAPNVYKIDIKRVYTKESNLIENDLIFNLKNFNLIIVKPDRRLIYTNCNWDEIKENGEVSDVIKEVISVSAKNRTEVI